MSWCDELYKVYEDNHDKYDDILPLSHSTANAQIQLTIDEKGNFISASRIEDKKDSVTVIPVTEDSGSRSSGVAPHPFADKLVYIADDYPEYTSGKHSNNADYHSAYMKQLYDWYNSPYTHQAVKAVYGYLAEGCIIKDLVESRVLKTNETTGKLLDEKINGIAQEDSFVRFCVEYTDLGKETKTWLDKSLYECFFNHNLGKFEKKQLCYATGKIAPVTYKHPSKIRNSGDKAKLLSSNDESGFAYRGRFDNKEQAYSVSYEFSQKIHSALKWLIKNQGISIENSMTVVAWESSLSPIPKVTGNSFEFSGLIDDEETADDLYPTTLPAMREQIKKAVFGYKSQFGIKSKVMLLILDSATTGRLSISLYDEFMGSVFVENIAKWHEDTAWLRFSGKKKCNYIGTFSLYEIVNYAFGTENGNFVECKDKAGKDIMSRLIPCIAEGRRIPQNLVNAAVNKASNPLAYSVSSNWRKVVELACGLIRKTIIENKGVCEMGLDENCTERSYLYGRLLAIADLAENSTYDKEDSRVTNAKRYFEAFSNRPYQTWNIIRKRLSPYLEKMPPQRSKWYNKLINDITAKFEREDFMDNSSLEPVYLHAYSCQTVKILSSNNKEEK